MKLAQIVTLRQLVSTERDLHEAAFKLETDVARKTNPTQPGHTLGTPDVKPPDFSGGQAAKLLN
jgi:hypothetical protein